MTGTYTYAEDEILAHYEYVITQDGYGKDTKVRKLPDEEARALICGELNFEFSSIKIEGVCWYEATDWNYFRFSVKGKHYEYKNFYSLKIFETEDK